MFASKKVKSKDLTGSKDPHKKSKNISKQFKSFMGRIKPNEVDNISRVTSVDSNTDTSIRSSSIDTSNIEKAPYDVHSLDEDSELDNIDKELKFPNWYKQTLKLPKSKPLSLPCKISLKISKSINGDFGFVLRKGILVERFTNDNGNFNETKCMAIFAEPVNMHRENLLLPGDKLIEVNNINTQNYSRDEIISLIKCGGTEVNLTVQPSPECLEFSFRRFTNLFFNHVNIRSWLKEKKSFCGIYKELYNKIVNNFESIACVELISKNSLTSLSSINFEDNVWINFNEGFASGTIIKKLDGGKCCIKLIDNNSEIDVSEEDIHPANSPIYDLEENLLLLPHINESSVLHNVRQRFVNNLIHTYIGKHILYLNPMNTLNCFSEKIMHLFKSSNPEDIPPHVYSIAQNTFQNLKSTKENQSICILGRSGSGKSMVLKHLVNYFTCVTPENNKCNITYEKIQCLWVLLDAFTCTRTGINTNANRCGKKVSLNFSLFNHNLILMGLNIQLFLLDRNRLFRRPEREPAYHIFYNFLAGVNAKQIQEYNLKFMNEPNSFMTPLQRESEKQAAAEQWEIICRAAIILGISENEWNVICKLLATIIHLGAAKSTSFQQGCQTYGRFLDKESSKRAADTLNCSEEALYRAIFEFFKDDIESTDSHSRKNVGISYNPQDLLNGFVSGLYYEIIEMIIFFINRCFNANYTRIINSIIIVDPPGFQVPTSYNEKHSAIYEDLLYNYAYERLLDLNYTHNIMKHKDLYNKENINVEFFNDIETGNPILSLLDGDCKVELFDTIGKKGLLNLIESEALIGNKKSFIKKLQVLFQSHHKHIADKKERTFKNLCLKTGDFTINHCNFSQCLKYNINDSLKYSRELPTFSSAEVLLSMCHNETIQDILTSLSKNQSEILDFKYTNKSVLGRNKLEMNDIISILTDTNHLSFIYCISPIPNAGLCQLKDSIDKHLFDENVTCGGLLSVPLVKIQLQSFRVLQILRVMKFSYPDVLTFDSFLYIVKNIIPSSELPDTKVIDPNVILKILNYLKVNKNRYRIGNKQIFFRTGTVFELKNNKELASTNFIIKLQSFCRRFLAYKNFEKLKLQTDAMRIIQRNSLLYIKIKEWAWWKLYSQIRPLLSILRADEELKIMKNLFNELQSKNSEIEKEKDYLKKENRQLGNSVDDLKNELVIYRQKIQKLTNLLEDKEKEQIYLNNQVEELQGKMLLHDDDVLQVENESICVNSESSLKENVDHLDDVDSKKYIEKFKDNYFENIITGSQEEWLKMELMKKTKDCDKIKFEFEEYKYKTENKANTDDYEILLQNLKEEIIRLHNIISEESEHRERLKRENDKLISEKILLEKNFMDLKMEKSSNAAIQSISNFDFNNMEISEKELLFKKQKSELEQRIHELEEEVDEMVDNYDLAQKEKLKLKLQIEKLTQDKINELNEKEDEIEHLKSSNAKKIKNFELQLEEDLLKRQTLIKDKREADRIIFELKQALDIQKDLNLEKKLKRELKATKDLLNDALDQIEDLKSRKDSKLELKELKDKIDDMEHINEILIKQKSTKDRELEDCHLEIDNITRSKFEIETKLKQLKSEIINLQNHNEDLENQNEQSDRKIRQLQGQAVLNNEFINNLQEKLDYLEEENKRLFTKSEKLEQELNSHNFEQVDKSEIIRLQNKISELDLKLHHEDSTKTRLQVLNERLKDQLYESQADKESLQSKSVIDLERFKKLEKQLKESRDIEDNQNKEIAELKIKVKSLMSKDNDMEEEIDRKNHELSLSKQRIQRLEKLLENDDENSDHSYSEILTKADNMIKTRKFSMDQNTYKNHDNMIRRNSIATEIFDTF